METTKQLTPLLKQLIRILKKENKALIESDGVKIEKISKQKETIADSLKLVTSIPSDNEKKLLLEVKQLQDDNLLLTQQAISFNDNFLKVVGDAAQKTNATYSRQGSLQKQTDVGFINHSM
ncbi:flagellar protein FlgN [Vagococcus hydrophili]|uniref:Flagellar protein FlgN n=1 Tax=Vagococcus hydrophili TaxID=2714947 RepID=A0A6G8AW60_9ENTE|nr:flagellar protein FlgN [Vagococcus hydrophili]QIL49321.1 flagellar protein FlgN [Vagococcus hydrophili]